MIDVGWFSEMKCHSDNGSIKEHIIENVNYDKAKMLNYLKSCKRIAVCHRSAIDCLTGEVISQSFLTTIIPCALCKHCEIKKQQTCLFSVCRITLITSEI